MGTPFLDLACQEDGSSRCPPIRYATGDICDMCHII